MEPIQEQIEYAEKAEHIAQKKNTCLEKAGAAKQYFEWAKEARGFFIVAVQTARAKRPFSENLQIFKKLSVPKNVIAVGEPSQDR